MTSEEINALTDPQINVMVQASVTGTKKYVRSTSTKTLFYEDGDGGVVAVNAQDYCNDPAVMMPIAFDYGIGIIKDGWGNFHAGFAKNDIRGLTIEDEFYDRKPCRAAAIVYLKMKGVL